MGRTCESCVASSGAGAGRWKASRPTRRTWTSRSRPTRARRCRSLIVFDRGDEVTVQAGPEGIRFLLVSGRPLEEPVAWYGPIVMNTKAELKQAMAELQDGTFIKH